MITQYTNIRLLVNDELFPSERAMGQLQYIARDPAVSLPVVALADIHDKVDNDYPTGIVVASRQSVLPQIMVSGPNCGMCMIDSGTDTAHISQDHIDRLFNRLVEKVKTKALRGWALSSDDLMSVLRTGAAWLDAKTEQERDAIELSGKEFADEVPSQEDIRQAIPSVIMDISRYRMGLLGSGNHFLELQKVAEVFDEQIASAWRMAGGHLFFLMHSGSGGLGAMISHLYSPRSPGAREAKMHAFVYAQWLKSLVHTSQRRLVGSVIGHILKRPGRLLSLDGESEQAKTYMIAMRAASNFAYANRAFIRRQLMDTIEQLWPEAGAPVRTLYDTSHMSLRYEKIDEDYYWVHRSGAVRAYPKDMLPADSRFSLTGTPVFLPGSMGDATYVCVLTEKAAETYFSMGHGAGRLHESRIKDVPRTRQEVSQQLQERGIRLYKGLSRKIIKQSPGCFKNIDATIDYLQEQGLIKKVAKLLPMAVLKG